MYSVKGSRMLKIAALAGLSTLALALPGAAQANSSSSVNGIGVGSNVVITGDGNANKFNVTWVKKPKLLKVQDLNGGTIDTSQYCKRSTAASAVECTPVQGSKKIKRIDLNYGAGDDTAPALTGVGLPNVTVDGGEGKDNLSANKDKGAIFYGGPGNDVVNGGPYGDQVYGGARELLVDPFGIDIVFGNGGLDAIFLKDFVGGDIAICQGGQGTAFIDTTPTAKDYALYCANVL